MIYRADLQGLRAFAVALVIAHHFFPGQSSGGFIGVDIFFVISGFIITSLLIRDREKDLKIFLLDFYSRRIRRIIPAALLIILVSVIASFYLLGEITGSDTARDGRAASLFIANIHFNSLNIDYFTSGLPEPILQHFWSLSIEEQFYLIWPLVFFLLARNKAGAILSVSIVSLASFIFAVYQVNVGTGTAYFSSLTRIWELGAGALLALLGRIHSNRLISYFAIAALLLLSDQYTPETPFPSWPTLVVILLTMILIVTGQGNRFLSSGPMVAIGNLSYILYLAHWPLIQIFTIWKGAEPSSLVKGGLLIALLALSSLIHRFYENPIRFSSHLIGAPKITVALGLFAIFSTALVLGMIGV